MRVEDLRNYGRGLLDSVPDPEAMKRSGQVRRTVREELRRELGPAGAEELTTRVKGEVERMKSHDWSVLREHGLGDGRFIDGIIQRIAVMKALADTLGMERASEVQCRILDKTVYDMMSSMWPSVEDYQACGDFFEAFKRYSMASMAANVRAGLHVIETVEDSPTALAFNVTYCAWHEVAKGFGDPYLCYPSTCYGDEVTIPRVLGQVGYEFRRVGTLAQGAPCCDFRYQLVGSGR